jgi:hypothetical protein
VKDVERFLSPWIFVEGQHCLFGGSKKGAVFWIAPGQQAVLTFA